jgi:hypothetical protein
LEVVEAPLNAMFEKLRSWVFDMERMVVYAARRRGVNLILATKT